MSADYRSELDVLKVPVASSTCNCPDGMMYHALNCVVHPREVNVVFLTAALTDLCERAVADLEGFRCTFGAYIMGEQEKRIAELEAEKERLGALLDEASVSLITGNVPNIDLCERIAQARIKAEREHAEPGATT